MRKHSNNSNNSPVNVNVEGIGAFRVERFGPGLWAVAYGRHVIEGTRAEIARKLRALFASVLR
jgi:hypothetical protein